jgi:uncharacterized Fe-S cluster-containing protein
VARTKAVEHLSINEIERLLKLKKGRLKTLEKKKTNLLRQVGSLDSKIASIYGSVAKGGGLLDRSSDRMAKPQKNEKSCREYILAVLTQSKKALRPKEIADAVLGAGYKSDSGNFAVIINQQLLGLKKSGLVHHDAEHSTYRIVKSKPGTEKAAD